MKTFSVFFGIFIFCFLMSIIGNAQDRKAVSGVEVTGTFRDVSGSEFNILALGKRKLRIAFSGVYAYKMANGKPMANVGEAVGKAEITGDTAVFKPKDEEQCKIILKFLQGGRLKIKQQGTDVECGFGANVSAEGNYKKVSSAKPKFTAR